MVMANVRQQWEQGFETHRRTARVAILAGAAICGISALGASPPAGTQPLPLGSLRPVLELWSRFFFGFAGPAALFYGLVVAAGLLYLGRGERVRMRVVEPFRERDTEGARKAA